MRARTVVLLALVLFALLVGVRASGWTTSAPDPLPLRAYAPTLDDEPRHFQTVANGTFAAGGGAFAWEVLAFPHMTGTGLHPLEYRVVRTGGEEGRVWPSAALLLNAAGYHVGEAPLGGGPTVEDGALVMRVGYQPTAPGTHGLTAVLQLQVYHKAVVGYLEEDPLEVVLPFSLEARQVQPTSEGPS